MEKFLKIVLAVLFSTLTIFTIAVLIKLASKPQCKEYKAVTGNIVCVRF